ncbi:MAG: FtsX-like permease family protein [Anaerovoracaceae bacterium]
MVTFKHDSGKGDGMTYLTCDEFTVTALVDSPAHVSYNLSSYGFANIGSGYIQCLAFTAPESFDSSAYPGEVLAYIRSDSLRGLYTSDIEYKNGVKDLSDEISALGDSLAEERYGSILSQMQEKISKAEAKLTDAKGKIEASEEKLKSGMEALEKGKAEYEANKKKLEEGYVMLTEGQQKYDDAKQKYDKAVVSYEKMKENRQKLEEDILTYDDITDMNEQLDEYSNMNVQLDELPNINEQLNEYYKDAYAKELSSEKLDKLNETLDYINENVTEEAWNESQELKDTYREQVLSDMDEAIAETDMKLKVAKTKLEQKENELKEGWKQYYSGAAKLEKALKQIKEGEKKLSDKALELEASKEKYDNGMKTLESYRKKLDKIKDYDWTVISRQYNGGQMIVKQYCDLTDNLRFSMAALFIIIGLLVSYSSISRIVRDQIVSIGTKKALGLLKNEITLSYLAYSGMAVFTGGVLGLLMGTLGIEKLLAKTIGKQFIMGVYAPYFSFGQGAIVIAAEMVLILMTTWLACRNILKQQAVELLKGEKPPTAKPRFFEKWRFWQSLPLLTKTVINNCINDKRRVFGTIIGVAGCTALIVTAVTMDNNIQKSFKWQYRDVYSYDTIVRYNAKVKDSQKDIQNVLDELGTESTSVYSSPFKLIKPDGNQDSVTVTVPFEDNYDSFVHLNDEGRIADEEYPDGIWVSRAYNSHFDAEPGDKIEIMDSEGQMLQFTIQGFFNHYLFSNQIVMSRDAYAEVFGSEAVPNAFLVDSGDLTVTEIKQALSPIKAVRMVKDDYQAAFDVFNNFSNIAGAVVAVYLVLSVMMAIIVLFDLYTVFIDEKKKELIILMINGFSISDARQYIYRDTTVLTIVGIVLGVIFGVIMGNVTIMTLEADMAYFVKGIDWTACAIGAGASGLLAVVLCSLALRKISGFKLADINKL